MGVKSDTISIFRRFRQRDFSGNTGLAVKNSFYNLLTNIVSKVGSLIFTIIIARLLLPELFGLYSLALSTIVLFAAFSDLGVGTVATKYLSKELSKKRGDPGKYYFFLLRLKLLLSITVSLLLISLAYFIAHFYYSKPVFLALLAGGFYIFINSLLGFFSSVFQANNDFKRPLFKEIIFQILRLILVPLSILLFLSNSSEILIFSIIIALSVSFFVSLIYLYFHLPKFIYSKISNSDRISLIKFILPMSATILSGIFFGYIDMIMLGRFVEAEYIGYYQAALALIGSAGAFVGFTAGALFPLFSRIKGERLVLLFKKSRMYTFLFSLFGVIATFLLSNIIINLVYGPAYIPAIFILRVLSFILVLDSMISIYTSFYISQNRPLFVASILIISTILNILLNYIFISSLVQASHYYATFGAAAATIIAKAFHLSILLVKNKSVF